MNDLVALRGLATEAAADLPSPPILVRIAVHLEQAEAWDEAVRLLRNGQARYPDNEWIAARLAFALYRSGAPPAHILPSCRAAIALHPEWDLMWFNFGVLLMHAGAYSDAEVAFRRVEEFRETEAETDKGGIYLRARYYAGLALREQHKWEDAEAIFREVATDARRTVGAYPAIRSLARYYVAEALDKRGKADQASAYRREVAGSPEGALRMLGCAATLLASDRPAEAEAEARRALAVQPESPEGLEILARTLWALGRLEEAEATARRLVALVHDGSVRGSIRMVHVIEALAPAWGEKPGNPPRAPARGANAGSRWNIQASTGVQVNAEYYLFSCARPLHGDLLRLQGRWSEAEEVYREVLKHDGYLEMFPDRALIAAPLGLVLREQGRYRESLEMFRRAAAAQTKSSNSDKRFPLEQWVRETEHLVELESSLPTVLAGASRPQAPEDQVAIASLCLLKGHTAAAARLYTGAFSAQPTLAHAPNSHRYNAACAAARASAMDGVDARSLSGAERAYHRKQAHVWLSEELTVWQGITAISADNFPKAAAVIDHWRKDPDLKGVRGEVLDGLPPTERAAWRSLWADAERLSRPAPVEVGPPARAVP